MAKEKSLVEEAIIQMKNLEEAVAENAKGILASTMKQEIKDLVKESLSEQDEDEVETEVDVEDDTDVEDDVEDDTDTDNDLGDEEEVDMGMNMDTDSEDVIDLTGQDSSEVLKVFQLLGPEDQIVVTKDPNGNINLKDNETNKEYMIVGENIEEDDYLSEYSDLDEEDFSDEVADLSEDDDWSTGDLEEEETIESLVERVFGDDSQEEAEIDDYGSDYMGEFDLDEDDLDGLNEDMMGDAGVDQLGEDDSDIVYEIEFDGEGDNLELDEYGREWLDMDAEFGPFDKKEMPRRPYSKFDDEEEDEEEFEFDIDEDSEEPVMESKKMSRKAPGVGMGRPKFKYDSKPNQDLPKKKQGYGGKGIGFGNAKKASKFDADKDNGQMDGEFRVKPKKVETKEAARTYGNGSKDKSRGLRKGITPNRNLTFRKGVNESVDGREIQILREKNEEYRKALNIFRNKLNEVAVFNSNLAYATRLFTEHSTSKQEKINILRRFDSVETIKESKNLYHQIKDELSVSSNQSPINESFERVIEKAPSTGSAVNLIESKTYENPQFLRMKDLMSKLR
jgi:hypothetical protein